VRSGFINSNPDLSVWDALPKVVSDYPNCIAKRQSFEEKPRALAHAVMPSTGEVASDIAECFGKWVPSQVSPPAHSFKSDVRRQ